MTELPQTDALPRVDEGLDPARVEEAFATFADRVRELESVASELRAELRSLRAERAAPSFEREDWPAAERIASSGLPAADWIAGVPTPFAHNTSAPRLGLEAAFLLLVAGLAGIADLSPGWIVLVMAVAWALVAASEWAAAARRSRWRLDDIAPALAAAGPEAADSTGPWDMPVVEATAIESHESQAQASESKTIVTKLPADAEPEPETAPDPDPAPRRRLGLRRRKQPVEAGPGDPWEA